MRRTPGEFDRHRRLRTQWLPELARAQGQSRRQAPAGTAWVEELRAEIAELRQRVQGLEEILKAHRS